MASCTMPIKDVGELVNALENAGELKRISAQVDPDLEIAEILRRTMYAKGPAILFENVKGYDMPVLGNAFGSEKMLQIGLEMEDFTEIGSRIVDMTRMDIPSSTLGKLKKLPELSKMGGAFPKLEKSLPVASFLIQTHYPKLAYRTLLRSQTILLVPLHTLCAVESLQSPSLDPLVLKFVSILRHSREHLQAHRHLLWAWCMMP